MLPSGFAVEIQGVETMVRQTKLFFDTLSQTEFKSTLLDASVTIYLPDVGMKVFAVRLSTHQAVLNDCRSL